MGFSVDTTGYVHTYEAYRIPKGATVKNAAGEDVILSKEEDTLVLTEEASKRLVKDRKDYGSALVSKAELAAEKTQEEASKKHAQDQAKAMSVFRSLSNGDVVPATDENKLMEYDQKLYQTAKAAQAMAQMANKQAEKKPSEWNENEEKEFAEKMKQLGDESNEAAWGIQGEFNKFSKEQMESIVEIDSSGVDFSKLKTIGLGGVMGAFIDLSI